jgi:adenosine deaminase
MTDNQIIVPDWLKNMPKSDLHCHMGGSMSPALVLELGQKYGVKLPADDLEGITNELVFRRKVAKKGMEKSLANYIDCIKIAESVLVRPEAFEKAAYEICKDANSEGVNIFELRFGPTNYEKHVKIYEAVEATLSGLRIASKEFNMHTGLIICGIKTNIEATARAAQIAVNYQNKGVVGFDLAGKEVGYNPKLFEDVMRPVLLNFLPVTIHAGEEGSVRHIAEALIYLNAERIGHGVALRESTKAFNYIDIRRKGLEICMTSNIDTGSVASYDVHPIREYYADDLRVSINTDNRTTSDTNITKEYMVLLDRLGFSMKDVFILEKHSIKSAFFENSKVMKQYLVELEKYAKQFGVSIRDEDHSQEKQA